MGRVRARRPCARARARSCTPSRRGRRRRAAEPSRPSSSPTSAARASSSPRSPTTSSAAARARSSRRSASPSTRVTRSDRSAGRSRTSTRTASGRSPSSARSCARPARTASLPWEELGRCDAVYFTGGDVAALRAARRAPVLVATARELPTLRRAGVQVDVLVGSGEDAAERFESGELDPAPRIVVTTAGALGGWIRPGGPFRAAPIPGPVVGRLRLRRLLRRRAHLRARSRAAGRRGGRPRLALRRRRPHGTRRLRAPTHRPRITAAGGVALDKWGTVG